MTHINEQSSGEADVVLSQNEDGGLTLHLVSDLKADVLDLSIKATPPGKFVSRSAGGRIGWTSKPQYFSFNKIAKSKALSTYVLEEPLVASRIPFNASIEIASEDRFLAAQMVWQIKPRAGTIYRNRTWIALALVLILGSATLIFTYFEQISDAACLRWSVCSGEQTALLEVKTCAGQAAACGVAACTARFQTKFPSGRLMKEVRQIEDSGALRCQQLDEERYSVVSRCVQEKINADACSIRSCFADYDLHSHPERVSQANTLMAVAAQRCRQLEAAARPAELPATPPAPNAAAAIPSGSESPVQRSPVLADGPHPAIQRYTGTRSRTDPLNCPASADFVVNVHSDRFTYARPDYFDGTAITRTWEGSIDQASGQITILGSKGSPPTKNAMTIVGQYDDATVLSDFCGSGFFKIER